MLAYLRAPRPAVLDACVEDPEAVVGPRSASGWTVAWLPALEHVSRFERAVVIDLDEVEDRVDLWIHSGGDTVGWYWEPQEDPAVSGAGAEQIESDATAAAARRSAALALHRTLDAAPDAERPLIDLLVGRPPAETLVDMLRQVGDLPASEPPLPVRSVVIAHASAEASRHAGALAAAELGDVVLADLGDGWTALVAQESPEHGDLLAAAVGTMVRTPGRGARRRRVLMLWRGEDGACGVELYRGEDVLAAHAWGTGWQQPSCADHESRDSVTNELLPASAAEATDLPRLRSLIRSDDRDGDPLAELVAVLALPPAALALLDRRSDAPASEMLIPAGPWSIVRSLLTGRWFAPIAPRWALIAYGVLCLGAALLLALLAGTKVAALVTDGAVVGDPAAAVGDWVFLVIQGLGTVLNGIVGVGLLVHARNAD